MFGNYRWIKKDCFISSRIGEIQWTLRKQASLVFDVKRQWLISECKWATFLLGKADERKKRGKYVNTKLTDNKKITNKRMSTKAKIAELTICKEMADNDKKK